MIIHLAIKKTSDIYKFEKIELKKNVFKLMLKASKTLGRYEEAMNLHKERLKIDIVLYNNNFHKSYTPVLKSYVFLIESQIQNKCFTKALKTCKRLAVFNLNSLNPKDVLKSLEAEGYKKYFPQSTLCIEDGKPIHSSLEMVRFEASEGKSPEKYDLRTDEINDIVQYTQRVMTIGTFCALKCMIFKELTDMRQCRNWSQLPLMIYNDVLVEWKNMEDNIPISGVRCYKNYW